MKNLNRTSPHSSDKETNDEDKVTTLSKEEMYELEKEINEKMEPFVLDDEERQKKSWIRASKIKIG